MTEWEETLAQIPAAQRDHWAANGPIVVTPEDPNLDLLLPQLRRAVIVNDEALLLKHPWVNMVYSIMVGGANGMWQQKFSMAREFVRQRDWEKYLFLVVERPWRMNTLERLWERERIERDELRVLLLDVWRDTELPHANLEDPIMLWREAGFATDDEEGFAALPSSLTVYRGINSDKGDPYGIAWTTHPVTARWFASRYTTTPGSVYKTEIAKSEILGYLTGRSEYEVIIDPQNVSMMTHDELDEIAPLAESGD